ncbi:PHP domain-containing protein [Actinoplanes sp. L3-i22]|uniref:PHP-associated domain-containing protein n=1 Tax=Actinoplanes sp. L3-i22 TaxID=2836373 RepID=UPI001C746865|nr:PHP domain-containing protein [Actinoplanes sp. L3-i22]BCY12049.1 hypothetical protein L3i22_071370 [Actinoplanes sp. L3-i22]
MSWYRGDFHVHTNRSHGGELTPAEITVAARACGLDVIAVTEHDRPAEWPVTDDDLLVIPGRENLTPGGHWLALGPDVLRVVAHPHAPYPGGTFTGPLDGFDLVEVWNGRWTSDLPWNADNEAALADWGRALPAGVRAGSWRPAIGNSDVHLRDQIGTPQTVVRAGELSAAAVLAALRAGHCWIAGSAAVDLSFTARAGGHVAGIGEILATGGAPAVVELRVTGVPAGEVTVHTECGPVLAVPISGEPITWSGRAELVRVEIRHPSGHPAALTNPIILV